MRNRAMRQGLTLALALIAVACLLGGCVPPEPSTKGAGTRPTASAPASARLAGTDRLSAWIADWDLTRGLAEWRAHPGLFSSVRVFAAYFDEKDHPSLAPAWASALGNDARSVFGSVPALLTVVNDVNTASGKGNKLKDPELVRRLVSGPKARADHIAELIRLTERYHFAGLEIDYENVTASVWPEFSVFVGELYAATSARGLVLSVLLQPQRRYLSSPMPAGPDYVLMGYNLFGSHSGPGPKATPKFLAEQAASLRAIGLLDATALALATGGFDWTDGKSAKQLVEVEADSLIAQNQIKPKRSESDGYQVSRYRDAAGKDHEVWHADATTFATLWQSAQSAGFSRLVVWRLGGNAPALLDWLATLKH